MYPSPSGLQSKSTPSTDAGLSASSSAPLRPSSRSSIRPSSSASIRPSSSAPLQSISSRGLSGPSSVRPGSSLSATRPGSSLSAPRSISTLLTRPSSQRSGSRLSQRPLSRQSSRLIPLCQNLVTQITGLSPVNDEDDFRSKVDLVFKRLDQTARPAGNMDMNAVYRHIRGHIEKARVNSHDVLAEALQSVYRSFKARVQDNNDLDSEIKVTHLPAHLHFLTSESLSRPPDESTLRYAGERLEKINNPSNPPPVITWETILDEEPFEGDHWEGLYTKHTDGDLDAHSGGSTPSLSPWDDSDIDESLSSSGIVDLTEDVHDVPAAGASKTRVPPAGYHHRQDIEDLQARQYWRAEWHTDASTARKFDIGDASTLGPTMHRVLGNQTVDAIAGPSRQRYIHEHDAVREVLMALQGDNNMVLKWSTSGENTFSFKPSTAVTLLHLTAAAQMSILFSFAKMATTLQHLRKFVVAIYAKAGKEDKTSDEGMHLLNMYRQSTLTLEAFAAAVDCQIWAFNAWCASKEEEICRAQVGIGPPLVVSLLSLDKSIRDTFSESFTVILDILRDVTKRAWRTSEAVVDIWTLPELPMKMSPSAFGALLLDSLLSGVQIHVSMGDFASADTLMRVFSESAEPIWVMVGRWMKDGIPVREVTSQWNSRQTDLDDEFFVEDNELPLLDPDFWSDGFVLREESGQGADARRTSVPVFLNRVVWAILEAGKAVGLLRVLEIAHLLDRGSSGSWIAQWPSFTTLLSSVKFASDGEDSNNISKLLSSSTEALSQALYDEIWSHSSFAQETLQRVLVDECDLWLHLSAIEDVYLMRRGDAMSRFVDVLFRKMDSGQAWNDFHFINSAFSDVASAGPQQWIDISLVRFSHRGSKDRSITRTVRAIDGLFIEYAVPFPLTYIFSPKVMQVYSSIFSFVLQIRRAKSVLERILVRGGVGTLAHMGRDMKVFYAMRSKLSWFVNTLLNFVATNVLHAQVLSFHEGFRQAKSLNDMIRLHDEHLTKMQGRCLLRQNTSALQRAIISILDMSIHFSDCFVAFAGDTTHDISRNSMLVMRRHRSRRSRRQRRDVIGFSSSIQGADESSDSDTDLDDDPLQANAPEPSFSLATSTMTAPDESSVDRLDKMSSELDALVRFIRRGVESLAAGSGEAAPAFGIFAFALEDWDR